MGMANERDYWARRAEQERARAINSADNAAAMVHRALAGMYDERAGDFEDAAAETANQTDASPPMAHRG